MSIAHYSPKVFDHFFNPRNNGMIEDANGIAEIGDPECGDHLKVYLKVENDMVKDIKFQIKGCPAAIACASAMTELVMGKPIQEAMLVSDDQIIEYIDGLPEFKIHCSALGASGFRVAVMDYSLKSKLFGVAEEHVG
ncbi:MAG: iron-sulfur cluster assembly scaffold protein [Desulfuromonadales bacterium]|nr:iron-sulfur cluster assembly scaffold protein [Desulfuromonadales bacterium]